MRRRKLKGFVIPTIYVSAIMIVFITVIMIGNITTPLPQGNSDFSVDSLDSEEIPVVAEVITKSIKPYTDESVLVSKDYYSKDDEEDMQKNSLILYQNTYLQNSGILYTAENTFDVIAVLGGTVKNVTTDSILGVMVEVSHDNNLTSFYYSLSEVEVKAGDVLELGQIIGKSGDNKIENKEGSSLLFEIYYQGKTIDPNNFYDTAIEDYK